MSNDASEAADEAQRDEDRNVLTALRVLRRLGELDPRAEEICGLAMLIGSMREASPVVLRAVVDELEMEVPD